MVKMLVSTFMLDVLMHFTDQALTELGDLKMYECIIGCDVLKQLSPFVIDLNCGVMAINKPNPRRPGIIFPAEI